jgi:hypothetical protein
MQSDPEVRVETALFSIMFCGCLGSSRAHREAGLSESTLDASSWVRLHSSFVFRSHLLLDVRWAWGSFGFNTKHQSTKAPSPCLLICPQSPDTHTEHVMFRYLKRTLSRSRRSEHCRSEHCNSYPLETLGSAVSDALARVPRS